MANKPGQSQGEQSQGGGHGEGNVGPSGEHKIKLVIVKKGLTPEASPSEGESESQDP
jgi:hypothetical protein